MGRYHEKGLCIQLQKKSNISYISQAQPTKKKNISTIISYTLPATPNLQFIKEKRENKNKK